MKIIEQLSEMISEEISDAEKYVRCALMHREDMPELSEAFYRLSADEMGHMGILHEQVTRIINQYKKEKGDPPKEMMAVYDYLHKKQIDHASQVRAMQAMYRS